MNTPNKITVFRILLTPIWLAVYLIDIPFGAFISAAVFAIACITDAIDGRLARKNNMITVFGKFLDPIADKMLVTAALLAFMQNGLCNIWIALVIIVREFVITSLRLIASSQGIVIPANIFGKIKTVSQMLSFIIVMILCGLQQDFAPLLEKFPIIIVSNMLLGFSALAGVISAAIYFAKSKEHIDFTK